MNSFRYRTDTFHDISGGVCAPDLTTTHASQAAYRIGPLQDPRWPEFVATHPRASVFHSTSWLEALRRTYGYDVHAFTTSAPDEKLRDAALICAIDSWLTGRRIVSLPFSDHCEVLVDDSADMASLFSAIELEFRQDRSLYIELRPTSQFQIPTDLSWQTEEHFLHRVDLTPEPSVLLRGFHKSSTQRKIRRAEREKLTYQEGRSESLLQDFWKLNLLTRRRHGVPPQPRRWFRNLIDCFRDALNISVAYKDDRPIASILTLRHNDTLIFKYGCSDSRFHNLGGTQMLFWRAMLNAKEQGLTVFDLGRSNPQNTGLIKFKERWGGVRSSLLYKTFRANGSPKSSFAHGGADWKVRYARPIFAHSPDFVLTLAGRFLYRHIG